MKTDHFNKLGANLHSNPVLIFIREIRTKNISKEAIIALVHYEREVGLGWRVSNCNRKQFMHTFNTLDLCSHRIALLIAAIAMDFEQPNLLV